MAWIESHQELGRHPKTNKLLRLLKVIQPTTTLPAVVGHLHFLWWWALDFAQDGDLTRYDVFEIAEAARWDYHGLPPDQWESNVQSFLDALIESGYIDKTDAGLTLHDWDVYAGKLIERRVKDRERKRTLAAEAKAAASFRETSDGVPQEVARLPSLPNQPTIPNQPNTTNSTEHTVPNQTNPAPSATAAETFAAFWEEYPKKVGKAKCETVWKRLKINAELFEKIMTALKAQKQTAQWQKEGGAYIPYPLTWLNQKRWEDEPLEIKPEGGASENGRSKKAGPAVTGFHAAE